MKALFGLGLVVLVLGILSFFVPFPKTEDHGIKIGDAKIGVQTQHDEHLSPGISMALLVVGGGLMIAGGRKSA